VPLSYGDFPSVQLLTDGRILLGGTFEIPNTGRRGMALLNADGSVFPGFTSPIDERSPPAAMIPATDGRFILAGSFSNLGPNKLNNLARLNADGSIDPTFNANALTLAWPSWVYPLADGRLIIATPGGGLLRLNSDGSRDASFTPQFAATPIEFGPRQSDGKIFYITEGDAAGREVRRLNADGTPDQGFLVTAIRRSSDSLPFPIVADDGAIYFNHPLTTDRASARYLVSRVSASGAVDANFRPRFSAAASATAFAHQPDGKVIVATQADYVNGVKPAARSSLIRFNADGSTDTTFSAVLDENENVSSLALQPDGRIVATGAFKIDASYPPPGVARFTATGQRDSSFRLPKEANGGLMVDLSGNIYAWRTTTTAKQLFSRYTPDGDLDSGFQIAAPDSVMAAALLPDGKVMIIAPDPTFTFFTVPTLMRLLHAGTIDSTFSADRNDLPSNPIGLAALPDGRVVVVGTYNTYAGSMSRFVRFTTSGAVDFDYRAAANGNVLDIAGVLYDGMRDAAALNGTRILVRVGARPSVTTVDVGIDGKFLTSASPSGFIQTYTRVAQSGPTFDPKPTIGAISPPDPLTLLLNQSFTFFAQAGGLFPLQYQWMKDGVPIQGAAALSFGLTTKSDSAGSYTVVASNTYGSATSRPVNISLNATPIPATVPKALSNQTVALGATATLPMEVRGNPLPDVQWFLNGTAVSFVGTKASGPDAMSTDWTLYVSDLQPAKTGIYSAVIDNGLASMANTAIVGLSSTAKVVGTGSEIGANIVHANGNVYDQVLLQGGAATITADANQVTRLSYVDLTNDIVQVEFSGAGTLSLVLDNPSAPAAATYYNQPGVLYVKGHGGIVITGANETTNVSVFSVGRVTAINQALFRTDVTYDGFADLAYLAVASTNGKFGGVRTANASYYATKGLTGIYAPGVKFGGPVFVGDINAFDAASPVLVLGSADTTQVNGGDLAQANAQPVKVSGVTQLKFVAGLTSQGTTLPAQNNKARLEQNGTDVTTQIVVNPVP